METLLQTKNAMTTWSFQPHSSIVCVVIEDVVMRTIDRWRQREFYKQSEACGILLGERRGERGEYLRVTHITEPCGTDQRQPTYYRRNTHGHQEVVSLLHRQSHGEIQYLGEWHTHPENKSSPSSVDYQEWARTTQLSRFKNSSLIFFIAGIEADWLGVIDHQILSVGTTSRF